jgi:hypothetical protein
MLSQLLQATVTHESESKAVNKEIHQGRKMNKYIRQGLEKNVDKCCDGRN